MVLMKTRLLAVLLAAGFLATGCGQPTPEPAAHEEIQPKSVMETATSKNQVIIRRDTWGVPHIFADSLADAAFGLGYAQAEDRAEDLFIAIRTATGTMAEAFGEDYIEQDYRMRVARNAERCQTYWPHAPGRLKAIGDRFIQGVQAWLDAHPGQRPACAMELEGWQSAAVGYAMILRWPMGELQDELNQKEHAPDYGSNAWAVAPSRSADGCAILLSDPHLTWKGLAVFYEARIHCPEADLCGFFCIGSPLMAFGHNGHVAWACTTGGPDTSDVYRMKLNPLNPMQYEFDGAWRDAQVEAVEIRVKDANSIVRPVAWTHLGPVLEEPDLQQGVAYVGASPYFTRTGLIEQLYRMNTAHNASEFREALAMNEFMAQNILFADTGGHIGYVRTGATPIRPDGYDWSLPVPGNTSATAWLGIHPMDDLVQIMDPVQGYLQNCNITPARMMKDSPLQPERYRPYIYNATADKPMNPRGRRALELLDADSAISKDKAMAIAFDVHDELAGPWQAALRAAIALDSEQRMQDPALAAAASSVLAWDGYYAADRYGAVLMRFWRQQCEAAEMDSAAIAPAEAITPELARTLLERFAEAIALLQSRYGSADPAWGEVFQVGREGRFAPASGAEYGSGGYFTETLFDVRSEEQPDGRFLARKGSMATQLMFLRPDGVESYSCTPWGQSGHPDSPHYMDQGEQLHGLRVFKPAWFNPEKLMEHLKSEERIPLP